jgi:hypothetical protein
VEPTIGLAGLAVPARDLGPRLPQIELTDLTRPIDPALKGPRWPKQRAHVAQIVIDDRLAARKSQRQDQLADPLPQERRIILSRRWISSLNGSSLGAFDTR